MSDYSPRVDDVARTIASGDARDLHGGDAVALDGEEYEVWFADHAAGTVRLGNRAGKFVDLDIDRRSSRRRPDRKHFRAGPDGLVTLGSQ